ncbi:Nodulin-like [Dillenia turbinata]|uniref:Nodulin-like n=1 Tax=Dillenia turbinata TaxID=194707 RepID=A0AAN8ZV78_9MAGN
MQLQFSSSLLARKWLGFVTAIWVQCISGNNYTFSNYSDALKTLMGLSQLELNNLSVAKDAGKAFGILAGLASDKISTPVIILIGSIEGIVGYGVQWLVVSQRIKPLPYWQMCVFLCMGGNSSTWMNTAILVTCMRNFRRNRGPVSGILKGYVGLSTAIFTDLCAALFADNPCAFLLMLAVIPFVVCLAAILFLRELPQTEDTSTEREENKYFGVFNSVAVVIALYLLSFDVSGPHGMTLSRIFAAGLLVLLASPLIVPVYVALKGLNLFDLKRNLDIEGQIVEPLLNQENGAEVKKKPAAGPVAVVEEVPKLEDAAEIKRRPVLGEDHTIFEAIQTLEFWILFLSFLCGVGTGLTVMNNMGQMGLALGYADVSMFISLLSIWGFLGRICAGAVSEYFVKSLLGGNLNLRFEKTDDKIKWKAGTPRPLVNAASQILMTIGYIVMAMALPGSLYIGSIVVGICYGVRLAVIVPTSSELFGLKYYGLVYNVLILNLPLGSFLFSGLLAGLLYDAQATHVAGGGNTCMGAHCYRMVFIVMALASVVGFGLDVLLASRTKLVYSRIYANKKLEKSAAGSGSS